MRCWLTYLVIVSLALLITSVSVSAADNLSESQDTLSDIISELTSSPKFYTSVFIQFFMGFLVGYFSFKVIKYVIALLITLVIGSFLSVWSLGDSLNTLLSRLFPEIVKALPYVITALQVLGIIVIGPVAAGFIIGALVGLVRR